MEPVPVRAFAQLPAATQAFIINNFKIEYGAGRLSNGTTEADIRSQAKALAGKQGYLWTPSQKWVRYLKRTCLGLGKRQYRKDGYGPEVEGIMAFIREQMGDCSEDSINRYRRTIASFVLDQGLSSKALIQAAGPTIWSGGSQALKRAVLGYMIKYYDRQTDNSMITKRPRLAGAVVGMSPAQQSGWAGTCESMEVDNTFASSSNPPSLEDRHLNRGMDEMTIRESATSGNSSGAAQSLSSAMPLMTQQPMVVSCMRHRSGRMTGTDAPPPPLPAPAAASASGSSTSTSSASTFPSSISRSSLKSKLKAELSKMCQEKGLAHNDKDTKDVLVSKLFEALSQPAATVGGSTGQNKEPPVTVSGELSREQQVIKGGYTSVEQMETVLTAMRRLLTHCEIDQLNWVAGVGCYVNTDIEGTRVESGVPQGYYCDVTPGRAGYTDPFHVVGIQRDLSEYTRNHFKVVLSLLKASYPVFLKHGFKPRPGYDLFEEDQLIWLVALTSSMTKLGVSGTSVVFLSLFTRFLDCRMRADTAVIGELTLAGTLGRIDSVDVKLRGAKHYGIKRVVVPELNWSQVSEAFRTDPEMEVMKAGDVIELLNCCLEEGQELDFDTAFHHVRHRIPMGVRVRGDGDLDIVECAAYPGTGAVIITGTEPSDMFEATPGQPRSALAQWTLYPRCNRTHSAAEVSRLWLCRVQDEDWFQALPKGRRRFDLRRMVIWDDCTESQYDDEGRPPAAGTTTTTTTPAGGGRVTGVTSGAAASSSSTAMVVCSSSTSSDDGDDSAAAAAAAAADDDEEESRPTRRQGGEGEGSGGEVDTVHVRKADLHIHFPDCTDDANIGLTVALALAQLMRGKLTPVDVSAMGEGGVDGQLWPDKRLGTEDLTNANLTFAKKVITVQYEGDEGFGMPKVPVNVRLIGVSNMREALQEAFKADVEEEQEEEEGEDDDDDQGEEQQQQEEGDVHDNGNDEGRDKQQAEERASAGDSEEDARVDEVL